MMRCIKIIFLIITLELVIVFNAYAYIDPGTGSYLLQLLAATFFGFLFTLRVFRSRLRKFINNLFRKKGD